MNYLIPVKRIHLTDNEIKFNKQQLDDILDQEIIICQMSSSINYQDIENMDEYERMYIISKLLQMKKEENEARERAYKELNNK